MNNLNSNITDRVKKTLLQIDKEGKVILFGSRARGTATTESDWDFLFLTTRKVSPDLWHQIITSVLDIELDENIAIQVIPKNISEWESRYAVTPLYRNIQKEGMMI